MILRLAAALALLVGAAGLLLFLQVVGKGPFASAEARHLRLMKDRLDPPPALLPATFADFAALPHARPVAEYAPLETRGVVLEGYAQRMIWSSDGDVHVEVLSSWRKPGLPETTYVSAEITPRWRRGSTRWQYDHLLAELRPNFGGTTPWEMGPQRMRLSGWLLYDFQYDGPYGAPNPHGAAIRPARSPMRLSGWEIHPVTRIELWDDSLQAFVEYPR